jgi:hypothetical protein
MPTTKSSPTARADAVDDFLQETHPMLERAAPLVVAAVAVRREELCDEVAAVGRVDLDAVVPTLARSDCGIAWAWISSSMSSAPPSSASRASPGTDVTRADERQLRDQARGLTARVAKLAEDLRAVLVDGVGHHLVLWDDRVVEALGASGTASRFDGRH